MINPYITEKLNPLFVVDESRRKELLLEAEKIPSVIISSAAASNAVMLASGYFNPLKGYMNLTEVLSVAEKMQLPSGILWPIPVVNLLKENNFSKSFVFGTVVLERLMDMLALTFFGIILLFLDPFEEEWISAYLLKGGVVILIIIITLAILSRFKLNNTENKFLSILNQILDGLLSIRKQRVIPVVISSILIWSIYLLDVYLIQKAFQFNLSWAQTLAVLVISSLVLSIPSAPGMIGTFHAAVKYTMVDLFAFTPNEGNSFAILMHAYGYILFTLLGAYYFLKSQFHEYAINNVLNTDPNELQKN